MRLRLWLILSIIATGLTQFPLRADEPQPPQDRNQPEVLERGPIHEAYAQPYEANPTQGEVAPQKPPEPVPEQPPDVKPDGKNVQWLPGYWQWDTTKNDFIWVSGFWRDVPDGRRWVTGYWTQGDGGWQWVSGHWAGANEKDFQFVPQPPPENLDQGPSTPAPDDQSVYVPGNWAYGDEGYAWQPGYWTAFQPGFTWVPSSYFWTPLGWSFTSGFWDFDFCNRGLLFAPVWFRPGFPFFNGFVFRPFFTTFFNPFFPFRFGFGFNHLFVNPHFHHFFFGDFHGSHFVHAGFHPWSQFATHHFDPIFAHERIAHRGTNWQHDLNAHVQGRANGTLAAHAGLTSLTQLQHAGVNLHTVSASDIRAQTQHANQLTQQSQHWTNNRGQLNSQNAGFSSGINGRSGIASTSHSFTTLGANGSGIHSSTANNNVPRIQSTTPSSNFQHAQTTSPNSINGPRTQSTMSNERFPQFQSTPPNNNGLRTQSLSNERFPQMHTTTANNNFPRIQTTTPNGNAQHSQSLSGPNWMHSPNTNLNPGWNRPQNFTPNNSAARMPNGISNSNWNSIPRSSFSNPAMSRMPTTNFQNHFTPSQSFSHPSFSPQSSFHPSMNTMPHTSGGSFHPSMGTMPHSSGGMSHPSGGGGSGHHH